MITEYNRTRELLRLPRHMLRLVSGLFVGHVELNRHLNIMGIIDDPLCNNCEECPETATHFLCECSRYAALRHEIWGKFYLYPSDIESVQDLQSCEIHPKITKILTIYKSLVYH